MGFVAYSTRSSAMETLARGVCEVPSGRTASAMAARTATCGIIVPSQTPRRKRRRMRCSRVPGFARTKVIVRAAAEDAVAEGEQAPLDGRQQGPLHEVQQEAQ